VWALFFFFTRRFSHFSAVSMNTRRERTEIGRANPFCQELIIIIADFTVELLKFFFELPIHVEFSNPSHQLLAIYRRQQNGSISRPPSDFLLLALARGRDPAIQPPLLVDLFNLEKNVLFLNQLV
jgi:hypothetical protein